MALPTVGRGAVVSSSMEKIRPPNTHLLSGTLKKLMAVKKGLNFKLRSETG